MNHVIKSLLAKTWKNENAELAPGRHYFDEEFVVRVRGTVEKHEDQLVAPTVSIPLVPTLALFWEKCGLARDEAMALLRDAISEAMQEGVQENQRIKAQIEDVNAAIDAVRKDLIAHLPKMQRAGRVITKDLSIRVLPMAPVEEQMA
jgi:hypothetical protein